MSKTNWLSVSWSQWGRHFLNTPHKKMTPLNVLMLNCFCCKSQSKPLIACASEPFIFLLLTNYSFLFQQTFTGGQPSSITIPHDANINDPIHMRWCLLSTQLVLSLVRMRKPTWTLEQRVNPIQKESNCAVGNVMYQYKTWRMNKHQAYNKSYCTLTHALCTSLVIQNIP